MLLKGGVNGLMALWGGGGGLGGGEGGGKPDGYEMRVLIPLMPGTMVLCYALW